MGSRGYEPGVPLPPCAVGGRGAGLYERCEYEDDCPVMDLLGGGLSHGDGVAPGVCPLGVEAYPMSPAAPMRGAFEVKLDHEASDVCVITRFTPGRPFRSGTGGVGPKLSSLYRAVPGLEVYSGRVVIVV